MGFEDGLCATYLGEVSDKEKAKRVVLRQTSVVDSSCCSLFSFHFLYCRAHIPSSPTDRLFGGVKCGGDAPSPPRPIRDGLARRVNALLAAEVKLLCGESTLSTYIPSSLTNDNPPNATIPHVFNLLKTHVFPAPAAAYEIAPFAQTCHTRRALPSRRHCARQ
jgi:hypothetical protein